MYKRDKIRVLIVDDSLVFREVMSRGISADGGIEVVATASGPFEARNKLAELQPDVMTLDVEMPKMNGIEFLKQILPQYPIPVVVASSLSRNVFDALGAGALDFVCKPAASDMEGLESFLNEMILKIKLAANSKAGQANSGGENARLPCSLAKSVEDRIIAIGSSTGGTEALYNVLKGLPKFSPPILCVQHMPAGFTKMYADRLNNSCDMEVREAKDGDRICPGLALIAPGNYQMRLRKSGSGFTVECLKGDKVNGHCPSVDVLFESVAAIAGKKAIGIILTGMGNDGAKGLLAMRKNGADTLGQNEATCVVYGMPKVAYDIGAVERQLPLDSISQAVLSLINKGV